VKVEDGTPVMLVAVDAVMTSYTIGVADDATDCSVGVPDGGAVASARATVPLPERETELVSPATPPPEIAVPDEVRGVAGPGVPTGAAVDTGVASWAYWFVPPHAATLIATSARSAASLFRGNRGPPGSERRKNAWTSGGGETQHPLSEALMTPSSLRFL
jgi:hypothetical protein